jgi:hypothetical protein
LVVSEKTKRGFELSVTALFALALVMVGAVLIFSGGTASAKQIATLRLLGGEVAVQHGDDALEPGEEGESLREGDIVRTGPDGRAAIEYFDGSLTRLDYDARFSLVTLETLRNPAESKVILGGQTAGNSYNRVTDLTDAESRFEIGTPTATASAQGTVYAVIVDEGSTTIAVAEGLVTASSASGSLGVSAGKMVVVGAGGAIGAVQDISQELLDSDWFAFNQCELDGIRECIENDAEGEEPAEGSTGQGDDGHGSPPGTGTGDGGTGDGGGTTGNGPPPPPSSNFDRIVISPSQATIEPGGSHAYTAEAFDAEGHSMGKVTAHTNFSIGPDGSCQGHTCTATHTGAHTVTGTYAGDSDAATLVVEEEERPPPACPHYALSFHSRPPETQWAGLPFNVQIKVDVLEGGSNNGPLTIVLQLQGGSFSGGDTSATWTGQGTITFNHLTIDEAGTYGLTGVANCARQTDPSSITITDSSGGAASGVAPGLLLLLLHVGRLRRRR